MRKQMHSAMSNFYFSLPRLIASWSGKQTGRSEKNVVEANVAGALNHLVVYGAAFQMLRGLSVWQQLLFLVPLAALVGLFWLILFHVNAFLIESLRRLGLMRDLPDNRAQNLIVGFVTTVLAFYLLGTGGGSAALGSVWIAAVALNLLAAAMLPARHAIPPASK